MSLPQIKFERPGEPEHRAPGHVFGDTYLYNGANAHQGDIYNSHDVNILGDIHFYASGATAAENPVVELAREHIEHIEHIESLLYFREESNRFLEIDTAHESTFSWIFDNDEPHYGASLRQWLEHGREYYWTCGKSGPGKSTLVKYIYNHPSFHIQLQK